jgi:hypothetical protein
MFNLHNNLGGSDYVQETDGDTGCTYIPVRLEGTNAVS